MVDTQGNILTLKVTTADVQDREGAQLLLSVLTVAFGWLKLIWADGGYGRTLFHQFGKTAGDKKVTARSDRSFIFPPH